ncbi:MAG: S9 family peptidase [Bacteroidetes bacterium]|nr:S9 family peptidase [Bacteroidota bacterium]
MKSHHIVFSFLLLLFTSTIHSQFSDELTIDQIMSKEMDDFEQMPFSRWLSDNTLLIYDTRLPMEERSFEVINPKDMTRKKVINPVDFFKLMSDEHGISKDEFNFADPDAISDNGKQFVYIINGDIYAYTIGSNEVNRITNSEPLEKSVRFSPDGKNLAFVRDNNLYAYAFEEKKEKQLTFDGSETLLNGTLSWVYWEEVFDRNDSGFFWSPNSDKIAYFQTDESEVSIMHYVDVEPWVPRVIKQRYPKTGEVNPKVRIGVVDIVNEKSNMIPIDEDSYEYIIRVNWLPDNNNLAVQTLNRMQDKLDLLFVNLVDYSVSKILTEREKSWIHIHDDLQFIEESNQFIWFSERSGYAHLYRYNYSGELVNQITTGEWQVAGDPNDNMSVRYVDSRGKKLFFIGKEKSPIERHLYEINFDGSGMKRISAINGTHQVNFSRNGNYFTDGYSSFTTMKELQLYNSDGNILSTISKVPNEVFDDVDTRYPEFFTIPAYDGFELPAYIFKPKDFDPNKKYPLILYVYGGPSASTVLDSWHRYTFYFNKLLKEGYLVGGIDNRSATGISKAMEETVLNRIASSNELKDLVSAVQWLKNQSYIDKDRVGIWGWSGGGTFTFNALTNSKEFKAGIAVAGVTDWHYYDTIFGERGMKTPEVNPVGYKETSLLTTAKNLSGDLLIVHGTYDDNVHIQNVYAFMEELFKAGKDFDMLIYPMRKHGISDKPARRHLFKKMIQYWKNHL